MTGEVNKWEANIASFETEDQEMGWLRGGLLALGSSTIRLWTKIDEDFPTMPVRNRGFGGATTLDVDTYLERILGEHKPEYLLFYGGGNDVFSGTPPGEVAARIKTIATRCAGIAQPKAILLTEIVPHPKPWKKYGGHVMDLNNSLARIATELPTARTVYLCRDMLSDDVSPNPAYFADDGIHLNGMGYRLLRSAVREAQY